MRAVPVLLAAAGLLLVAPGSASADVIFDPADADDLAATLTEAYNDQKVCYGWRVTVSDPVAGDSESVGSNFGAGKPVTSGTCEATVEFLADITYTSESSESEDYASYDVQSSPSGVSRTDLDALGIDFGGLTGEDPDIPIGQAVSALPLLAADADLATPIPAAPATGEAPADAQLTDDPGSDWWRERGGMVMWAVVMLAAAGLFAWWVVRTDRRRRARRPGYPRPQEPAPVAMPEPGTPGQPVAEPETEELPVRKPSVAEPPTEELPTQEPPAGPPAEERVAPATGAQEAPSAGPTDDQATTSEPSTVDQPADRAPGSQEQARPAPSDQKDKE